MPGPGGGRRRTLLGHCDTVTSGVSHGSLRPGQPEAGPSQPARARPVPDRPDSHPARRVGHQLINRDPPQPGPGFKLDWPGPLRTD